MDYENSFGYVIIFFCYPIKVINKEYGLLICIEQYIIKVLILDSEYEKLLDRAFSKVPNLSTENVDFKIPTVDSIVQGTKTIIKNFSQIAGVARRGEGEIAKYITKELAAPVSIEEQRLIISAKVNADVLNSKLKKYFETYVVCKECHKPDTNVISSSRGFITLVCEACGARYTIKHY